MLATMLANRGYNVEVFEKRPDMRKDFVSGNRTIAMSISKRGIKALQALSLTSFVTDATIPKHSRMVHHLDGHISCQRYGQEGHTINTVDRRQLNEKLIEKAEATGKVTFHFQHECEEVEMETGFLTFRNPQNAGFRKQFDHIIAADGVFSNIRRFMEIQKHVNTEYIKIEYGYRELLIPPNDDGQYQLDPDHVHVWPRENYILVGLPSIGNAFTCNLFMPSDGPLSLTDIQKEEQVMELFKKIYPNVIPLMPTLVKDYFLNAASKIQALNCFPWNYKNKILLMGDAAHAIVPFFAMGMNTCFEDCTDFGILMDKYDNDLGKTIEHYGEFRKPNTDAISKLSYNNFKEIAKSPSDDYHEKWHLERKIWDLYPNKWMPLYPMIAFSTIPLAVTIERAEVQSKILSEIIKSNNTDLFSNDVELKKYLDPKLAEISQISEDYL